MLKQVFHDRKSAFRDLPREIILAVFQQTETYYDALFLALTCSFLWNVAESLLRERYSGLVAPAKGHRLINLGDYSKDLPHDLSTPSCIQRLIRATQRALDERNAQNAVSLKASVLRICEYASSEAENILYERHHNPLNERRSKEFDSWYQPWYILELPGAEKWMTAPSSYNRSKDVMMLRNLSKRVYVRSDTFSVGGRHGGNTWGFGRALVFRTTWSTDPSCSMCYDGLTRGVWAGDRFDVVKLTTFQTEAGEASWTDVTQEVKDEMTEIAKSEFGDDWHKYAGW